MANIKSTRVKVGVLSILVLSGLVKTAISGTMQPKPEPIEVNGDEATKTGTMQPKPEPIEVDGDEAWARIDEKGKNSEIAPGNVNEFLERFPIDVYSKEKSLFPLANYCKTSSFSLKNLIEYLRDIGYTITDYSEEEIIRQLKNHGARIIGNDVYFNNVDNINLVLFYKFPDVDIKISVYERYIEYLLRYSVTSAYAHNNTNYSYLLYGSPNCIPKTDIQEGSLYEDYAKIQIKLQRGEITKEDYLQKLIEITHNYSSKLKGSEGEISITEWEKLLQQKLDVTLITDPQSIQNKEEKEIMEIANLASISFEDAKLVKSLFDSGIGKLYKEEEIYETIIAGDNSLEDISKRLAKKGVFISAEDIRKQVRRKSNAPYKILGDNGSCPQLGASFTLDCIVTLPIEEQKTLLKTAYLNYISSLKEKLPEQLQFVLPIVDSCLANIDERTPEEIQAAYAIAAGTCDFGPHSGILTPEELSAGIRAANSNSSNVPIEFSTVPSELKAVPTL